MPPFCWRDHTLVPLECGWKFPASRHRGDYLATDAILQAPVLRIQEFRTGIVGPEDVDGDLSQWLATVVPDSDINIIILSSDRILMSRAPVVRVTHPDVGAVPEGPAGGLCPGI